ncbi:ligase-associated DNA damage response DEXH box helicase [Neolewinella antarctica]|uniref:ATP-dependent Lhr-like helicase n=1 Tax=Neolewinella antarctica TaxID=442734 RepID=A0ABX0XC80_9BACT|nr:ligase-associated DNA damage response DEXH box helicase [Neolewinella antarctica]NJC26690.1 ATP-dependent Lhr-like helicase [Neolewinella antarctica]
MATKKTSPSRKSLIDVGKKWFTDQGWTPFPFQLAAWNAYLDGHNGLVNAPTGSGKTYSLIIPILLEGLLDKGEVAGAEEKKGSKVDGSKPKKSKSGLRAIWITPIRALTREIQGAAQRAVDDLGLDWQVAIRSGDTSTSDRAKQKKKPPEILITTPESLHLLIASKGYEDYFGNLRVLVADEWHELVGTKRGVLLELALSRLRGFRGKEFRTWGISATIGNLPEAMDVLQGIPSEIDLKKGTSLEDGRSRGVTIRAAAAKEIEITTVMPDKIETFPWAGHLGIKLLEKVIPIIHSSGSTLVFTNTRAQCEIWYQRILDADPNLSGAIAMHHGSIGRELRDWVENALHEGTLKAVICTSSLDLGVDFRPVETIVQIGSPKSVARFMQRAGRSGHRPGAKSVIHFVPTHSLELLEASAIRQCIDSEQIEQRIPYIRSFDVLVQYLVTLAVSDGFRPDEIFEEVKKTYCFSSITREELNWCLEFITTGGNSLGAYDEYHKVVVEDGLYKVTSRRVAMMHRMGIGAIVSEQVMMVKYLRGGYIGTIEEYFVSSLKTGDTFWFAGRSLKLVKVKGTEALVRKSNAKSGKIPSWRGGRMQLSGQLAHRLRESMEFLKVENYHDAELAKLKPLRDIQARRSAIPAQDELLIEYFLDREGYHLLIYPCEGRGIHEGLASLFAYRIGQFAPLTFTIANNDYGFELLSDQPIPIEEALGSGLFDVNGLTEDLEAGINATEMASRRFRDIAAISGLIFKGYPGKQKKEKHLQSSSKLFFDVFTDYEPTNLLLTQAYDEIMTFQLQESRLREALDRINRQTILFEQPAKATPFSFALIVDRLREKMTSEKLEDRIKRMRVALVRD